MFGWPVKAGCKVCFRTVPMWFGFILLWFVCEQSWDGGLGGLQGDCQLQKERCSPPSPHVYTAVQYHLRSSRKKEKIGFGIVGGGPL